jgi:hypothetical protein
MSTDALKDLLDVLASDSGHVETFARSVDDLASGEAPHGKHKNTTEVDTLALGTADGPGYEFDSAGDA